MPGAGPAGAPAVSVVVPTYNRQELLAEAIGSVQAQTVSGWELVVVDDGSDDGTAAYLDTLADPRIRVVRLDHTGSSSLARIAGVGAARGEWLAFLDSDDLWLPEKLELQLRALAASPHAGWSYTGVSVFLPDGTPYPGAVLAGEQPSGWILERLLRFQVGAHIQSLMVHREALAAAGGFDPEFRYRGDYDLVLRLAARFPACGVAAPLTRVRHHPGRTTSGAALANLLDYNEMAFRKAEAAAAEPAIRRLCRYQRAVQLAARGRALAGAGQPASGLASVLRALRLAPLSPAIWRSAAGWARSLLPGAAVAPSS